MGWLSLEHLCINTVIPLLVYETLTRRYRISAEASLSLPLSPLHKNSRRSYEELVRYNVDTWAVRTVGSAVHTLGHAIRTIGNAIRTVCNPGSDAFSTTKQQSSFLEGSRIHGSRNKSKNDSQSDLILRNLTKLMSKIFCAITCNN